MSPIGDPAPTRLMRSFSVTVSMCPPAYLDFDSRRSSSCPADARTELARRQMRSVYRENLRLDRVCKTWRIHLRGDNGCLHPDRVSYFTHAWCVDLAPKDRHVNS